MTVMNSSFRDKKRTLLIHPALYLLSCPPNIATSGTSSSHGTSTHTVY